MEWNKLTFAEQLGNIGSELSRAKHWQSKNDIEARDKSLLRALELIDLSLNAKTRNQLRELVRLRELVADCLAERRNYNTQLDLLERYCLPFAVISRS